MTMGTVVGKCSFAFLVYLACIELLYPVLAEDNGISLTAKGEIGNESNITCVVPLENATVEWQFQGESLKKDNRLHITASQGTLSRKDQDGSLQKTTISTIIITNTTSDYEGNYTCIAKQGTEGPSIKESRFLDLSFPGRLINTTKSPIRENATNHNNVTLECIFEVYKPGTVVWSKRGSEDDTSNLNDIKQENINLKQVKSSVVVRIRNADNDDGSYVCEVDDHVTSRRLSGVIDIHVYAMPVVAVDKAVAVNTTEVFLNWTVKSYRQKIANYTLMYRVNSSNETFRFCREPIDVNNTSFVLNDLNASTEYQLVLQVTTAYGTSKSKNVIVRTLDKEPVFVPNISINGFSATSVTIGWQPPPEEISSLIHYYLLEARKKDENSTRRAYHSGGIMNLPYMFDNLEPHSTYIFRVRACSEMTRRCGPRSADMQAATLDGTPGRPARLRLRCGARSLRVMWEPPERPNAEIKGYMLELTGNANYIDKTGKEQKTTWGPLSKFTSNDSREVRFEDLQPNTQYTVRLSAMTRTRRRGEEELQRCTTARAGPDLPPSPRWRKILDNDNYYFKVYIPRVSERNGPICCYRVYMVRVAGDASLRELSPLRAGHSAHLDAYVTDIFSNKNFPPDSELVMGDGRSHYDPARDPALADDNCSRCLKEPKRYTEAAPSPPTTTTAPTTSTATTVDEYIDDVDYTTDEPDSAARNARHLDSQSPLLESIEDKEKEWAPFDRPLDPNADYTLYVELIPGVPHEEPLYSVFLNLLRAAAPPAPPSTPSPLELILQVTCGVAAAVLLAMLAFCVLQAHRFRKPPHAHLEMNPIQSALSCMGLGGRGAGVRARAAPVPREQLAAAYLQRQLDSDYGFQNEFESLQSECHADRTTHASEARENQHKNRYPDIKAYDQTRVKLSQIDSITGSDYINANYVMGYQDRKKFICAQGPTDATVNDFWRMVWEQRIELIVMLTNLEEYSKVKCSKYWPDEVRGVKAFGSIAVTHVAEKRYSDYIVRELRITKQQPSEGQPVIENNGVAKRNGDIKEPQEWSEEGEARVVRQYHFLMWKDFGAPEYPQSILKFIKRVNEAWAAGAAGGAAAVHCSAGVGRTGTLVALDVLLDELRERRAVSVLPTVADLRRQRNFLVQSLKQYIFVYRALVEYAHYGDTELPAAQLRAAVDRLRSTPDGADRSLMEVEFEKVLKGPVEEPPRPCAGGAEELRCKNRSQEHLPYTRNQVILAPLPGRDYSTYINASFIEAYDNWEGFIITQDPLPNTIADFWRMVSEHNVSTIVMLSELGEGKCPRYWEDGAAQYEQLTVQYEDSESLPYYTRRQFRLISNKGGGAESVRQLQYVGWPTAPGAVPEVTRGVADLADLAAPARPHRLLVHCQTGCERSPLFVALCVLTAQLRAERRVDVCGAVRKLRAQRDRTIDTFSQYEFLHRAILNYAELHNLLEDS
ncbi:tyrosine-protein phosphatase 69D isoform X2 [Bombyx mori]|uniref:tyrosine-protein phosphatase 69D isoform X2 n=1 Tax=Bombyx mori TaxID=7091 RepID=UPI002ED54906